MSFDPHDDDLSGFGLRRRVLDEASVNASGGYSIPGVPFAVAPYKSLAVFAALGGGGTFTATVTWDWDGFAGGATSSETKTSTSLVGETLLFHNQGPQVTDVTITGDATTAYAVALSDADPLASAAPAAAAGVYPSHQWISLPAQFNFGNTSGAGHALVVDALCYHNFFYRTNGLNAYFDFYFLAGPQYARHELIVTGNTGPDYGIIKVFLASIEPDAQSDLGYSNPSELMQNMRTGTPAPTFVQLTPSQDRYAAVLARNLTWARAWRVEGAEGDPLTAFATDSSGFKGGDGGPGLYCCRLKTESKNGASTDYKADYSEIGVHRIGDSGFP